MAPLARAAAGARALERAERELKKGYMGGVGWLDNLSNDMYRPKRARKHNALSKREGVALVTFPRAFSPPHRSWPLRAVAVAGPSLGLASA